MAGRLNRASARHGGIYIDITTPLGPTTRRYPDDPPVEITPTGTAALKNRMRARMR